jgi:MraZ protein
MAQKEILKFDRDGRVIVGGGLIAHANITDEIVFVGLSDKFQMWNPQAFDVHLAIAGERVRKHRLLLGARGQYARAGEVS